MENYDISKTENLINNNSNTHPVETEEPAKYFVGFLAGLGVSVVLAGLVALISCLFESVFDFVVAIATLLIGITVQAISNRHNFLTAIISAVCGCLAVAVFTSIMEGQGYVWDDGTKISDDMTFYMIVAAVVSGWAGWRNHGDD